MAKILFFQNYVYIACQTFLYCFVQNTATDTFWFVSYEAADFGSKALPLKEIYASFFTMIFMRNLIHLHKNSVKYGLKSLTYLDRSHERIHAL